MKVLLVTVPGRPLGAGWGPSGRGGGEQGGKVPGFPQALTGSRIPGQGIRLQDAQQVTTLKKKLKIFSISFAMFTDEQLLTRARSAICFIKNLEFSHIIVDDSVPDLWTSTLCRLSTSAPAMSTTPPTTTADSWGSLMSRTPYVQVAGSNSLPLIVYTRCSFLPGFVTRCDH